MDWKDMSEKILEKRALRNLVNKEIKKMLVEKFEDLADQLLTKQITIKEFDDIMKKITQQYMGDDYVPSTDDE